MTKIRFSLMIVFLTLFAMAMHMPVLSQDADATGCSAEDLDAFIAEGLAEFDEDETDPAYIYRLGDLHTEFALQCGYQPTTEEIITQIDRTLMFAPLSFIIAQSSIGTDVDLALAELETVNGDSFNGQLLYNGLEFGLDGAELGCAGCHNGEAAPLTEGTYTRVEEIRLNEPEFEGYTVERYLVESILHPADYIVPDYASVQMPANYGGRLDAQQLADLVAYLESQDQLLDNITSSVVEADTTNIVVITETILADYTGDTTRGENLYNGTQPNDADIYFGCAGCHTGGVIGPMTIGTWTRISNDRLSLTEFEDYTAEQYIIEAILMPNAHIPDGYTSSVMPLNYREQMSDQDLADLVAYIRTLE